MGWLTSRWRDKCRTPHRVTQVWKCKHVSFLGAASRLCYMVNNPCLVIVMRSGLQKRLCVLHHSICFSCFLRLDSGPNRDSSIRITFLTLAISVKNIMTWFSEELSQWFTFVYLKITCSLTKSPPASNSIEGLSQSFILVVVFGKKNHFEPVLSRLSETLWGLDFMASGQ